MCVGCELNGCVLGILAHVCCAADVLCGGACGLHAYCASLCVCVSWCVTMCVLLYVPGCTCLGGCLCSFALRDVMGLHVCECLSDTACVWQHVGLWTGLA